MVTTFVAQKTTLSDSVTHEGMSVSLSYFDTKTENQSPLRRPLDK